MLCGGGGCTRVSSEQRIFRADLPCAARRHAYLAVNACKSPGTNIVLSFTRKILVPVRDDLHLFFVDSETAFVYGFTSCRNRDDGFGAGGSQQGLRAKQAQLELESDMQGREKVLGEENIGHNLLKKMGACVGRLILVVVFVGVSVFAFSAAAVVVLLLMLMLEQLLLLRFFLLLLPLLLLLLLRLLLFGLVRMLLLNYLGHFGTRFRPQPPLTLVMMPAVSLVVDHGRDDVMTGWSEGTGLGSSRSGMVEPISGSGQASVQPTNQRLPRWLTRSVSCVGYLVPSHRSSTGVWLPVLILVVVGVGFWSTYHWGVLFVNMSFMVPAWRGRRPQVIKAVCVFLFLFFLQPPVVPSSVSFVLVYERGHEQLAANVSPLKSVFHDCIRAAIHVSYEGTSSCPARSPRCIASSNRSMRASDDCYRGCSELLSSLKKNLHSLLSTFDPYLSN